MRNARTVSFVLTLAALCSSAVLAADAPTGEPRNEIVVFGGISLLDVTRSYETTLATTDDTDATSARVLAGFHGLPGRGPITLPPISVTGETSLGSSVLFGARYSRKIKDRLALEADLSIAPNHELESHGELCIAGECLGSGRSIGDWPGQVVDGRLRDFLGGDVTAWQYGAGLAYEITGGDVRPIVTLGAGGVSWDGAGQAETNFVFRFGAGLKVLFGRVGARVDVVDHLVLDHFLTGKTEHDVQATAGLLVGF